MGPREIKGHLTFSYVFPRLSSQACASACCGPFSKCYPLEIPFSHWPLSFPVLLQQVLLGVSFFVSLQQQPLRSHCFEQLPSLLPEVQRNRHRILASAAGAAGAAEPLHLMFKNRTCFLKIKKAYYIYTCLYSWLTDWSTARFRSESESPFSLPRSVATGTWQIYMLPNYI